MGKLVVGFFFILLFSAFSMATNQLKLVGNTVATLIDEKDQPARLIDLVTAGFDKLEIEVTATTQAWSGSGLRSGKFIGYIDHYSLNSQKTNYIYSLPYAKISLHIASIDDSASAINRLDQLAENRIGIERRFANTDILRVERRVKWSRADNFYENMLQISEQRVNFILADKIMLEEMNKLLIADGEKPLSLSPSSIIDVDVSVGLRSDGANAQKLLDDFNQRITALKVNGKDQEIYYPASTASSKLDPAVYNNILRKW
ncbi:substrate-binding periplasmic protein [Agaribacter marinus]|uniref:Solute-binding protein family 3/N-terminal domain-containing protein n=1 Tax=Agaribacter marinus TaxID=1431249 RepID=A0AA37WLG1_9ALTE|nr:ABC transporter substrate-binding protein [Agaribacter marinus]GLR72439.1 hypothetical protein GCM10007852_33470 [Agaribacter marinus]